jgi:hypothetical protein
MLNRTQALVVGFLVAAWASLMAIMAAAPDIVRDQLQAPADSQRSAETLLLAGVWVVVGVGLLGVIQRWRWMFWLLLVASLGGALRVPAAALQVAGIVPTSIPGWYILFQATIGVIQFAIGVAMLAGYRRHGVWGPF